MRFFKAACAVFFIWSATTFVVQADRIGRVGPTYSITEQDFLEYIQQRLKAMEASGDLARLQEKFKEQANRAVKEPKPVEGITRTETARTFYVDPGVTIDQTITDHEGKIIVPAGTYKNPLDVITLRNKLFFFDGNDPRQRAEAKRFYDRESIKPKLILVSGRPFDMMEQLNVRVYFDQTGVITKQMGITHVPSVVSQEGRLLRVDEIKAN